MRGDADPARVAWGAPQLTVLAVLVALALWIVGDAIAGVATYVSYHHEFVSSFSAGQAALGPQDRDPSLSIGLGTGVGWVGPLFSTAVLAVLLFVRWDALRSLDELYESACDEQPENDEDASVRGAAADDLSVWGPAAPGFPSLAGAFDEDEPDPEFVADLTEELTTTYLGLARARRLAIWTGLVLLVAVLGEVLRTVSTFTYPYADGTQKAQERIPAVAELAAVVVLTVAGLMLMLRLLTSVDGALRPDGDGVGEAD